MLIVDAHLDIAMNAVEWNRDLTRPLAEVRAGARPANVKDYYDAGTYRPRLGALEGKTLLLG